MRTVPAVAVLMFLFVAGASWADQTEWEPNNSTLEANGPINFNERLTGGLPGVWGGGDTASYADYWLIEAKKDTKYNFHAHPVNSSFMFPLDIDLDLEDSSGHVVAQAKANGDNQDETLDWTAPADGNYYLIVYEGTDNPNSVSSYNIDCSRTAPPDVNGPTYPTGVTGGVISGERINENKGVHLTWQLAQDDVTVPAQMQYDVFYSTIQAGVFAGAAKQTFVGETSGDISGLDVTQTYYFGVRARDEANNSESNTKTIGVSPETAAADWARYE